MRMAELAARSGVARETIHFYLREGLLPRPRKGGRTVAYYGEEHLERLLLIRRLREEKYLPIAVIRRILEAPFAAERDLDTLADVLHILPQGEGKEEDSKRPDPSAAAHREAEARGLLGRAREAAPSDDSAERRVLAVVEEALALDEAARRLTLSDLEVCAGGLSALVAREAEVFFDAVFQTGDLGGSIAALRSGRGAVARFVAAYRDLMLRRIVEDLLLALQHGPEAVARAATVPLSATCEAELGVQERGAALRAAADRAEPGAASALVLHLFGRGAAAELADLPPPLIAKAGARLGPLLAWGAHERARSAATLDALERAVASAPELALGPILLGEAIVARGVRRREDQSEGFLSEGVPALQKLIAVDPARDPEPLLQAFSYFHRGRVELALPAVLGRSARGAAAVLSALAILEGGALREEPAAAARIAGNARLVLARYAIERGDRAGADALFAAAAAVDPEGPIAEIARAEAKALPRVLGEKG